ncbi:hypothetical protein EsDP_00001455 [Epichloe bromicola]|uniref:Copper transporter n=1 Tax=Epichloe bromicola TaxID=79588 RepID=A0ABQ0CHW7_9HYPO
MSVPETCRNGVGNGPISPPRWNLTLIDLMRPEGVKKRPASAPKVKIRVPSPLRTPSVVFNKEGGSYFSYPPPCVCYLPYGVGCCAVMLLQGNIVDWHYRRIAKKLAATAAVDHMFEAMGMGWTFTLLSLLMVACLFGLWVLEKLGPRWRAEKAKKKAEKKQDR